MSEAEMRVLISGATIERRTAELARQMVADYGDHPPLVIGVLNGAVHFMMALINHMPESFLRHLEYDFIGVSSYTGEQSSGAVRLVKDLVVEISGRDILLVEGIVDTGLTLNYLLARFQELSPRSMKVCTLLDKPARRRHPVPIDYRGFAIEDVFVVGYGLDCAQRYRGLPYIGIVENSGQTPLNPIRD